MHEGTAPEALQPTREVADPGLRRAFVQTALASYKFLQVASGQKLEHDVNTLRSWHGVHEGHEVRVLDTPKDLDLVV